MFDVAATEPTPPFWLLVVTVLAIDVAVECVGVVLALDVLEVVFGLVKLGAEVGTAVVSAGSVDRGPTLECGLVGQSARRVWRDVQR